MKDALLKPIGKMLVEEGIITAEQLDQAFLEQCRTGEFLCETVIRKGFAKEKDVIPLLAKQLKVSTINLQETTISPEVIKRIPARLATYYKVMPVKYEEDRLVVAMVNPQDVQTIDELRLQLSTEITPVLAGPLDLEAALIRSYGFGAKTMAEITQRVTEEARAQASTGEEVEAVAEDASIARFVQELLLQAQRERATDIHLEPFLKGLSVRFRIDGVLQEISTPPMQPQVQQAVIARIKLLAHLNIAERRLPQDGRIRVALDEREIDLRISVLPTIHGEGVVIRLLSTNVQLGLEQLGFNPMELALMEQAIRKPHGMVLVTGPTGSGKTTTLYAALSRMNSAHAKIITIEDPVEYRLDGIEQMQIHPKIGLTFAQGLRSMLRHDPDILMVGEIRDPETAEIAIRSALTGHLVFSTLHTNDAASAVTRLVDMGIEPYLVASSCELLIAQRLIRLICAQCKVPTKSHGFESPLYKGKGCDVCHKMGYFGRTAVYELLAVDDDIRGLILNRASAQEIRRCAIAKGMRSLKDAAWEKVTQGLTTVEEMLRIAPSDESAAQLEKQP